MSPEGWLALVATPIGNLGDITLRALRTLKEADLIAAEDTRKTRKLCSHYDIDTDLTSYHQHNEYQKTSRLLDKVEEGTRIAVVSNAGTPAVSDPGYLAVQKALERGIEPRVIPGVSALTFAVPACGLPVDTFTFLGFPPRKQGKRRNFFRDLRGREMTYFVLVSVHRISDVLVDASEMLGPRTKMALVREATKMHEEVIRGTAEDLVRADRERGGEWRGEFVLAIDARTSRPRDRG